MLLRFDLLALVKIRNQIFISHHIQLCILLQSGLQNTLYCCILGGLVFHVVRGVARLFSKNGCTFVWILMVQNLMNE